MDMERLRAARVEAAVASDVAGVGSQPLYRWSRQLSSVRRWPGRGSWSRAWWGWGDLVALRTVAVLRDPSGAVLVSLDGCDRVAAEVRSLAETGTDFGGVTVSMAAGRINPADRAAWTGPVLVVPVEPIICHVARGLDRVLDR